MPIKNPFRKSAAALEIPDLMAREGAEEGFQKANVQGAKPVDIQEPLEYQLSEINDNGVYLPPPPLEKKGYFSRSSTSTSYSTRGSDMSENNEPFSISRESFDSYRRSFDISARSPICSYESPVRQSLDSRRAVQTHPLRSSFQDTRIDRPNAPVEEGFEEVGLHDEIKPKKRGLFARFGDSAESTPTPSEARPMSSHHNFLFNGRKRGQSGQGAELRHIPRPSSRNAVEVGGL